MSAPEKAAALTLDQRLNLLEQALISEGWHLDYAESITHARRERAELLAALRDLLSWSGISPDQADRYLLAAIAGVEMKAIFEAALRERRSLVQ